MRQISSRELTEWQAYYQLEPFGEERADLRMGILASVIAEIYRNKKKRSKPFSWREFLPRFGPQEYETQPVAQQLQIVEMLNAAFGGKDLREK